MNYRQVFDCMRIVYRTKTVYKIPHSQGFYYFVHYHLTNQVCFQDTFSDNVLE